MPCRADGLGTGLGPMTEADYAKLDDKGMFKGKLNIKEAMKGLRTDRDVLTQMLCKLCTKLEKQNLLHLLDKQTAKWWKKHKAFDEKEGRKKPKTKRS